MVKTNLLTKKNVFSLNILLSLLLVAAIIFLTRDIISGYFEKKMPVEKNISASAGALNTQRTMQLMEYAPIMKNNPFGFPGGEIRPLSVSADAGVQQQTDLITDRNGIRAQRTQLCCF